MEEPITIAAIVGTAIAAAGTGYSIHQGQQQAKDSKDAMKDQSNVAAKQRADLMEKQKQEEASTAARQARSRQQLIGAQGGKKSNVLTTPLGLPPEYGAGNSSTYLGGGK